MSQHDALLTGLPRSGTTLVCELLNLLPDTVALNEPMEVTLLTGESRRTGGSRDFEPVDGAVAPPDARMVCDEVDHFLAEARETILSQKRAYTRHVDGRVLGRMYSDDQDDSGLRPKLTTKSEIEIEKSLLDDFLLVVKHPGVFTAHLATLVPRFRVYATVRNPLPVLSSWNTISAEFRDGHFAIAELIDRRLAAALARIEDRIDRQLHLLGWFFETYLTLLPEDRIIRYESIVETRGTALTAVTNEAVALDEPLRNRNTASIYDREEMRLVGERLLETDGPYWRLYAKESVEELLLT